jgi:RNA polymerase sigma-70 factor (ECF subfamily)
VNLRRSSGIELGEGANSALPGERIAGREMVNQALAGRSLVDLARSGDAAAFESLVRSRMDAMYRLGLAILGDEADAADAAQETFVAAWRELPRLRDLDRFDAWLQRVAVNSCRMVLRARGRRRIREIPMAELDSAQERVLGMGASGRADAELLRTAIRHLSLDQGAILALHHLDGRPVAEVAEILGIPVGTAKSRLFKARTELEKALREEERR